MPIFSESNGYSSILIIDDNYAGVLIDDNQIAFPSLGNLMLAIADYKIAGNNLKQNNQSTRMLPDILHNRTLAKI